MIIDDHQAAQGRDRDSVLVWTADRELTRFHRDGTRAHIALPFTPLDVKLADKIYAVDPHGAVHGFSRDGAHAHVTPLLAEIPPITQAALSADGSQLAVLAAQVELFERGVRRPWSFTHRRVAYWREHGVGLSGDGRCVLVHFDQHDAHGANLGDRLAAFEITRSDGVMHYRHIQRSLHGLAVAMSHDARRIAYHLDDQYVRVAEGIRMTRLHLVEPKGRVHAMRWFGARLAILFDYELVIVDEAVRRISLPEHFTDVALVEDEAVCVHPDLGVWWIKVAVPT